MKKVYKCLMKTSVFLVFLISSVAAYAQDRSVSGTVKDETGQPMPGVNVIVKGTASGTASDGDGKYTLSAPENATLVFTFVGYTTAEVPIGTQTVVDVQMSPDATSLSEIVVTGYSSESKANIIGAVSVVNVADAFKVPAASLEAPLQGRVAGVSVTSSGAPGDATRIRIRGIGTIGNNNPLYVIDGLPVQGSGLNDLNPNDVESIQVLKDASSASIYGARAANGVIIVTTKKGKKNGGANISFNATYGVQSPSRKLPKMANAQELADITYESQINGSGTFNHSQYGSGSSAVVPNYIHPAGQSTVDETTYVGPNIQSGAINADYNPITRSGDTDWLDEIFQSAPMQQYSMSATGGSENATYGVGFGYFGQEGILINTGYERFNMRANTQFTKKRFKVGENFNLSLTKGSSNLQGNSSAENTVAQAFRIPSIVPVYDVAGNFAGTYGGDLGNAQNPVSMQMRQKDNFNKGIRALGNVYAEYEVIDGLSIKSSIGGDVSYRRTKQYTIANPEAREPNYVNGLNEQNFNDFSWTWSNTLNYTKSFGNHNIQVLAGTEAIHFAGENFGAARSNFFTDNVDYQFLNGGASNITNNGGGYESSLFSVFGKVGYDLNGKYLVSGTIRRDGSSRFLGDNKYGIFPAFNAGWRISKEAFLQNVSFISDLKIRYGWGQTGNQNIPNGVTGTAYRPSIATASYDFNGANSGVVQGFDGYISGNPDLVWETTTTSNIGVDASFLNNSFDVSIDYFTRKTSDMLFNPAPPALLGFNAVAPFLNIGDMSNKGFEITLTYRKNSGDFKWDVSGNLSTYKNNVDKLAGEPGVIFRSGNFRTLQATATQEGHPAGAFYGFIIDGIFQTQAEVDAVNANAQAETGDPLAVYSNGVGVGRYRFRDVNGDGIISVDGDQTYIGSPHPDFMYGFNFNGSYKGLDLALFFQGVSGNDLFNGTKWFTDFPTFPGNRSERVVTDSWGYNGVTTGATLPQLSTASPSIEYEESSYFIEDGSYLRLKNIQLGYTLPKELVSKAGMNRVRFYVQGVNLLTATKYTGFDPEISLNTFNNPDGGNIDLDYGVDGGVYPVAKSILFGVNIDF